MKKVAIIGAGYVGLTSAAIFANAGYKVACLDVDESKINTIKGGKSFFFEEGINPLLEKAIKEQNLEATTDYKRAIEGAELVFSCVGTPDNPDGSSNLSFIYNAAKQAAPYMKNGAIFVQKSTVPVGTGKKVDHLLQKHKSAGKVYYTSSPEFLREGTAVIDLLNADRVVVGNHSKEIIDAVFAVYKQMEKHKGAIAKISNLKLNPSIKTDYVATSMQSAELIKVASNAFLALKISFANSIAKLADHTHADVNEVMDAVGADRRIGRAFLNAGRGYGGGCFPKDVSGLISSATEHGVDLPIMIAASDVNGSMPGYIANKFRSHIGKINGKKVAVLGLAFKNGTSDVRRSPGVKLANILSKNGAQVKVYDPQANHEARDDLRTKVKIAKSLEEAVKDTDAVFIATDWPEFKDLGLVKLKKSMKGNTFVDCMNCFDKQVVAGAGFAYIGVGR